MEFKGYILNNVDANVDHPGNPFRISPAPFNKDDVTETAVRLMKRGHQSKGRVFDENATDPLDDMWDAVDAGLEPKKQEPLANVESSIVVSETIQNMSLVQALKEMVQKPELRYVLNLSCKHQRICIYIYRSKCVYIYLDICQQKYKYMYKQFAANLNIVYI
jgi:hypothetical protein